MEYVSRLEFRNGVSESTELSSEGRAGMQYQLYPIELLRIRGGVGLQYVGRVGNSFGAVWIMVHTSPGLYIIDTSYMIPLSQYWMSYTSTGRVKLF